MARFTVRSLLGSGSFPLALTGAALLAACLWKAEWALALLSGLLLALALATAWSRPRPAGPLSGLPTPSDVSDADLLQAAPDPVVTVDRRGVVIAANAPAREMMPALRPGEPLSFSLRAPEVLDAIRSVAASGRGEEVLYGGRTATEPTIAARLRPLPAGRSERPAIALFFSDRTQEHRVEAMRVDFIATVSHELRTPLASLVGFIDTIAGPARDDAAARTRFLGIMREQAGRMARLVDDLLQLSRVELNEHVPPRDAVDLGSLAAHMAEIMGPLARDRGTTIRLDLLAEPAIVRGDRDQLLRVAENLIENAVKYGGEGEVSVTLRRAEDGRAVLLSVADEGPGIPSEHIPRLTERFYRVNEQESRARGGTGLGLAIVKHVVGRHRGRLSIESRVGEGTTVTVRLPLAERHPGPGAVI